MNDDAGTWPDRPVHLPYKAWRAIGVLLAGISAIGVVAVGFQALLIGWDPLVVLPGAVLAALAGLGLAIWLDYDPSSST